MVGTRGQHEASTPYSRPKRGLGARLTDATARILVPGTSVLADTATIAGLGIGGAAAIAGGSAIDAVSKSAFFGGGESETGKAIQQAGVAVLTEASEQMFDPDDGVGARLRAEREAGNLGSMGGDVMKLLFGGHDEADQIMGALRPEDSENSRVHEAILGDASDTFGDVLLEGAFAADKELRGPNFANANRNDNRAVIQALEDEVIGGIFLNAFAGSVIRPILKTAPLWVLAGVVSAAARDGGQATKEMMDWLYDQDLPEPEEDDEDIVPEDPEEDIPDEEPEEETVTEDEPAEGDPEDPAPTEEDLEPETAMPEREVEIATRSRYEELETVY